MSGQFIWEGEGIGSGILIEREGGASKMKAKASVQNLSRNKSSEIINLQN
jgi:hypothetical protein